MDESQYRTELKSVLAAETDRARERLRSVLAAIPAAAQELEFEIFPDQDGEGTFSVSAGVVARDLYVLNKALGPHRVLFDVVHMPEGLVPPVPLVDPATSSFDARDVVVDCAAEWLHDLWVSLGSPAVGLPVTIRGHDGFGTLTPIALAAS